MSPQAQRPTQSRVKVGLSDFHEQAGTTGLWPVWWPHKSPGFRGSSARTIPRWSLGARSLELGEQFITGDQVTIPAPAAQLTALPQGLWGRGRRGSLGIRTPVFSVLPWVHSTRRPGACPSGLCPPHNDIATCSPICEASLCILSPHPDWGS